MIRLSSAFELASVSGGDRFARRVQSRVEVNE